tara:strand:- start:4766 stop:6043 length:1278 start_codon:yes stop_codon:yes gene_type:complete
MAFRGNIVELVENESVNGVTQISASWSRIPLKSVAKVINGFAFKSKQFNTSKGTPLVRIRDVLRGYTDTFYEGEIPDGYWVERDDILVGMDGDFNTCRWPSNKALLNQRVCKIEVFDSGVYDSRFLFYLLPTYLRLINENTSATTVKHLSSKTLAELPIPNPSIDEQKRIADKLDSVLAKVEAAQTRLDKIPAILKRFRQSVLAAAASGELTKEWREERQLPYDYEQYRFDEILVELRNGLSAKPNEDGKGTPILRISSVRAMEIDQADIRYLEIADKEIEKYKLKTGDLLFTRYNGSLEFVGVCGVLEDLQHDNLVYPDKLIRARLNEKALPKFIEILFSSPYIRDQVTGCVKTTSGQKGISGKDLKEQLIMLPSVSEQNEIVISVTKLLARARRVEKNYTKARIKLDSLTQSILSKAFSGKLS